MEITEHAGIFYKTGTEIIQNKKVASEGNYLEIVDHQVQKVILNVK